MNKMFYASCIDGIPSYLFDKDDSAAYTAFYGFAELYDENIWEVSPKGTIELNEDDALRLIRS